MPDPTANAAVFLSYAREDTDAARRIAEALRAFGVEAWFDQSELRGGDTWDSKIRGQIRACTLFLPVVSARTQARAEGYFRREWKLAVERTHDMAAGVAFIVPVVIDDTPESEAAVPDEFMRVQWTRLPHGVPTPQFVEQVKRLLEAPRKAAAAAAHVARAFPPVTHADTDSKARATPEVGRALRARLVWFGVAAALILTSAVGWMLMHRSSDGLPPSESAARRSAPPTSEHTAAPKLDAKSIAVLPFENLSAEPDSAYFADGMHEEVLTAVGKVSALLVIGRASVLPYADAKKRNYREIAAVLGVASVVEGSVRRAGNRVRIAVQLVDAQSSRQLWGDSYERELTDVFAIQSTIAQEIAAILKATLTPGERALIERRPTQNQEAYDLFLRARLLDQNMTWSASREEYERVIALYEQAAAKDPAFALPHVQASILHGSMYWFAVLDATPARRARALNAVETAQRLAPGAPESHLARGSFEYTCNNDWVKALAEYRQAEVGLPNDAQLHFRIGLAHRRLGQLPEALGRFERSTALNPNAMSEVSTQIDTVLALRRYRQVVELCARYEAISAAETYLVSIRIRAQYELDGDRAAYLRGLAALPPARTDPHGLDAAYNAALRAGDLAAAERVLADPRLAAVIGGGGLINEPVALHRALVAWLRGRPDDARRLADEAIAAYRLQKWEPRQQAWARMGVAQADALAGRTDTALRGARLALDEQTARDVLAAAGIVVEYGRVLLICNRRDEALALLRDHIARPGLVTPNEIRFDPFWSRLKDDPRFEEILKSAKPL